MPTSARVRAVKSFWVTWDRSCTTGKLGQLQSGGRLSPLDEGVDVARTARVEEHVALTHAGLLRQQARGEQRLAHRLGQRALVAGEAARQVGELGVVAAPLAHAVEALQD